MNDDDVIKNNDELNNQIILYIPTLHAGIAGYESEQKSSKQLKCHMLGKSTLGLPRAVP